MNNLSKMTALWDKPKNNGGWLGYITTLLKSLLVLNSLYSAFDVWAAVPSSTTDLIKSGLQVMALASASLLMVACFQLLNDATGSYKNLIVAAMVYSLLVEGANFMIASAYRNKVELYGWAEFYVLWIAPLLISASTIGAMLLGYHHPTAVLKREKAELESNKEGGEARMKHEQAKIEAELGMQQNLIKLQLQQNVGEKVLQALESPQARAAIEERATIEAGVILQQLNPLTLQRPDPNP